jgi:hypothetical protein
MTSQFHNERGGGNESISENLPGPYDDLIPALAAVPRPRAVRMSRRGKSTSILVTAILLVSMTLFVAGLMAQSKVSRPNPGSPQLVKFALPIFFILVFVPFQLTTVTRQKILIAEGEIAAARVIERRLARHGPTIRYEFTTPLGEHFSHSTSDGTGQLSPGMRVPIFYDSKSPGKQLALCASFYEVVMPGEADNS